MNTLMSWLAFAREDVTLLADEYLPEFLLVALALSLVWIVRKALTRGRGSKA